MAKKTKGGSKKDKPRVRRERRFEPRSAVSARVVYLIGAVGAILMGAGAWGQFGAMFEDAAPPPLKIAPYILALGAVIVGVAIWVGTSGEPALRVGDAGIAVEKRGLQRMPWYEVKEIAWSGDGLRVSGKTEMSGELAYTAKLASHAQAIAWILKEARERVASVVSVPEGAGVPDPLASAGEVLNLEPPQVVGKHCAASGRVIAYEPDARICPRCERVYHKASVPETCECGASLADVRGATAQSA
jgi:hypothetical protein